MSCLAGPLKRASDLPTTPTVASIRQDLGIKPSKKRKAKEPATMLAEDTAAYEQDLHARICTHAFEDVAPPSFEPARNHINKLLDTGIMTKTEFAMAIGGSLATLGNFPRRDGPHGRVGESSVWRDAFARFKQREVARLKMPDVRKRRRLEMRAAAAGVAADCSTTMTRVEPASVLTDIFRLGIIPGLCMILFQFWACHAYPRKAFCVLVLVRTAALAHLKIVRRGVGSRRDRWP